MFHLIDQPTNRFQPENVLLDADGHVRLTDFGLSKEGVSSTHPTRTFCGTPEYLAPEVVRGQMYSLTVDWWALGILIFEMMTGLPPFYHQNLHLVYTEIVSGRLNFDRCIDGRPMTGTARSIVTGLLARDPANRLGARGASEVKSHPFFASIDWVALAKKETRAPFIPRNVDGSADTSNIDEEFTSRTPRDTPVMESILQSDGLFLGFTYVDPSLV